MIVEVLKPVLVIVVGFLIKLACAKLNIELDSGAFNTIVAGIVTYLVGLLAHQYTAAAMVHFLK